MAKQHPLYKRWAFIKEITTNPNSINYQKYAGAQGIKNLFTDFQDFVDYVETNLGPIPFRNAKLYRPNQQDHFRPGNLAWGEPRDVSLIQQRTYKLRYKNQVKLARDWATEYGLNYHTFLERIGKGWTMPQALGLRPSPRQQQRAKNKRLKAKQL